MDTSDTTPLGVVPFVPRVVDAADDGSETKQRQIDLLVDLLARVRSGEIVAVGFAGVTPDGRSFTNWCSRRGIHAMALNGAVSILHGELITSVSPASEPVPQDDED